MAGREPTRLDTSAGRYNELRNVETGAEGAYAENLDKDPSSIGAGAGLTGLPDSILGLTSNPRSLIDPALLPVDPKTCTPVYPHQYLKVNTVFEVATGTFGFTEAPTAGALSTAWRRAGQRLGEVSGWASLHHTHHPDPTLANAAGEAGGQLLMPPSDASQRTVLPESSTFGHLRGTQAVELLSRGLAEE